MELLRTILLWIHVPLGGIALAVGLLLLLLRKGGPRHRRIGQVYFWAMTGVCITALLLAAIQENMFFLTVGVFSYYGAYTGYRSGHRKHLRPNVFDWAMLGVAIVGAVLMLLTINYVLLVFGVLALSMCVADVRLFLRKKQGAKSEWLPYHIGRMMGSYIAAITAFAVNNFHQNEYALYVWLGPTVILTPLIIFWTRKYRPRRKPAAT